VIVACGETLVELHVEGDGSLVPAAGCGPVAVVRALARLGAPCALLAAVSTDALGCQLRDALAADGVRLDALVSSDRPTTLAVAERARSRLYPDLTAAPSLTPAAAAAALARVQPTALHVGATALALEPLGSAVEHVLGGLEPGVLVLADPAARPDAIADPVRWRARLDRVLARADVVCTRSADLARLAPALPPRVAARRLLGRDRARCVLLADHGAVTIQVAGAEREVPTGVPVSRATFAAGFLAAWSRAGLGASDAGSIDVVQQAVAVAAGEELAAISGT
jgi:fructokinase